ncbi:MAG: LytR/AlgR family response regulator transcription factor [Chitinophagaceae bacterium]
MKILLIDNEAPIREGLKNLILAQMPIDIELDEANGVQTGFKKIQQYDPDIVFLDVEMDDGTGFDLLRLIQNPTFQLVFTTAHQKYAIDAFKFSAIDYLLKPVDADALHTTLQKAIKHIRNNDLGKQLSILMHQLSYKNEHDKKIVLKDIEATYYIKVSDILYCEAEGTYTKFYFTNNDPILVSKNLKEYEAMLEPLGFIRTHHSYLANTSKIKMFDKTDGGILVLEGGLTVPISQRKKEIVLTLLEQRI